MAGPPTAADELFDPAFLDRLRALFLRLRKRRQLRKKGSQSTPATGFTREFKDFRSYTQHDDYRAIDWRMYARLEKLFVRLYEEVQEFHVHVLLDTSESMAAPHPEKQRTGQKLAVALGALGLVSQHRVSFYTLSEKGVDGLPPLKGQGQLRRLIEHVAGLNFGGLTDFDRCVSEFRPGRQRFGVIFMISDFFGRTIDSAEAAVNRMGAWPGEPHLIHLFHPAERRPDLSGECELADVETGEKRRIWLDQTELDRYQAAFEAFRSGLERACWSRHIDYAPWTTDLDFEDTFFTLLSRGSALAAA